MRQPASTSIWGKGLSVPATPVADKMEVEIAIVGAGVAGLSAAYLLARRGYEVHVFDGGPPGGAMTSHSTSHIATALDDGWRGVVADKGIPAARQIAEAYTQATQHISRIVQEESIDCDFAACDGLLIGGREKLDDLEAEIAAARHVGIEAAWSGSHPFAGTRDGAAIRFAHQARLHPLKYVQGLLMCIIRDGGRFHHKRIQHVVPLAAAAAQVTLSDGLRIRATKGVILATNAGLCFPPASAAQRTYTSYVIAARVPKNAVPDVVCWDLDEPYHYMRLQPASATEDYLVVGGEDHDAVAAGHPDKRYKKLEDWARRNFPAMREVVARWSGQIRQPADNLGFLGRDPIHRGIFIVDGDGGLGFTHATVGALMIEDMLASRTNAWTALFDPQRYGPLRHELVITPDAIRAAS